MRQPNHSINQRHQLERLVVFAPIACFAILLMVWLILDHRLPAADEAGHILNSYTYADLLRHPQFWQRAWLYKFLTVNQFYPPAVYVFNGVIRLLVGRGNQADIISLTIFNLILSISTFSICRLLTGSSLAGILAVIFVNTYPNLNFLSHQYLLDYPLVAMISLGLLTLIWWKQAPSAKRALIGGIAIGAVCMTKQIAACYLALPLFLYFAQAVKSDWHKHKLHETVQLIIIGLIVLLYCLPWLCLNAGAENKFAHEFGSDISTVASPPDFFSNLTWYLSSLPHMMSLPLLLLFLLSLLITGNRQRLLPVGLSALSGIILVSTTAWQFPKERYLAPCLVASAIYSAAAVSIMLQGKSNWLKPIAAGLLTFALLQFFLANFTPYPISVSGPAASLSKHLSNAYCNHPAPQEDWGQEWVIKEIDRIDKKQPVWLNVLSNSAEINVHTFEFVAARLGSNVKPTTPRRWTIVGDCMEFSPTKALYCQWYLLNSSDTDFQFKDAASKLAYNQLINFVRGSGHFYLVGEKLLPDGTVLSLYRQK